MRRLTRCCWKKVLTVDVWNLLSGVSKQSTMEAGISYIYDLLCLGKALDVQSITVLDNGCLCCSLRDDLVGAISHSTHPKSSQL